MAYIPNKLRLLKQHIDGRGRLAVVLSKNGIAKTKHVHRLVLDAFVGPLPHGLESAHLNGNMLDARLSNLRYVTHTENESHKRLHGTLPIGEQCNATKLTAQQVKEIREAVASGRSRGSVAIQYGMNRGTIGRIVSRELWKHVV